jgi:hypothetical protein
MYLRRLRGIDLSGKLRVWSRQYDHDVRRFDYENVRCHVSTWSNGTATVGTAAYCSDPRATGLGTSPTARLYSSGSFPSIEEAERHLHAEVSHAARKFPSTVFHRRLSEQHYIWSNVRWEQASSTVGFERCRGCGSQTSELIVLPLASQGFSRPPNYSSKLTPFHGAA